MTGGAVNFIFAFRSLLNLHFLPKISRTKVLRSVNEPQKRFSKRELMLVEILVDAARLSVAT